MESQLSKSESATELKACGHPYIHRDDGATEWVCMVCNKVVSIPAATDSRPTSTPQGAKECVAWLIERGQAVNHNPTIWWCGGDQRAGFGEDEMKNWTQDAMKASRFKTHGDADSIARKLFGVEGRVHTFTITEHVFYDSPPSVGADETNARADVPTIQAIGDRVEIFADGKLKYGVYVTTGHGPRFAEAVKAAFTSQASKISTLESRLSAANDEVQRVGRERDEEEQRANSFRDLNRLNQEAIQELIAQRDAALREAKEAATLAQRVKAAEGLLKELADQCPGDRLVRREIATRVYAFLAPPVTQNAGAGKGGER